MKSTKPSLIDERSFPFECSVSYGVEDGYQALHWHNEIEICYIRQGRGKYLINGIEHDFSAGDIFVIGNNDIHLCHEDEDLIMQVIMFDPHFLQSGYANPFDYEYLRPFLESSEQFSNQIMTEASVKAQLAAILTEIEAEYAAMHKGYALMIKALLLRFLALTIRYCFTEVPTSTKRSVSRNAAEKIRHMILFIEEHYAETISLNMLSRRFDISIPYLCSTFKTFTGSSPIDFLIRRRILAAKSMLAETDQSVITIAEECGFGSLSNFNHLFRVIAGCTPVEYRKTNA